MLLTCLGFSQKEQGVIPATFTGLHLLSNVLFPLFRLIFQILNQDREMVFNLYLIPSLWAQLRGRFIWNSSWTQAAILPCTLKCCTKK